MVSDPSRWGTLALASVINLHKWLSTVYVSSMILQVWPRPLMHDLPPKGGINIGEEDATTYAFQIATDFVKPKDKPNVWFKDLFAGIAAAVSFGEAIQGFCLADNAQLGILGGIPATKNSPWVKGASVVSGLIGSELTIHLSGPE